MVKLFNKKEISMEESPIMLQRRHTVMEVDTDCSLKEPKLKSITRSNSTSIVNQTRKNELKESSMNKQADTTSSPEGSVSESNASTVVITESELSSSWLYNNKKAQIKTSPVASSFISSSRLAEVNNEMRSPMLPKSKKRSTNMVSGRPKRSSFCCYTLIILVISVAALGILAAIASILYMEFFASYNATDIQITTKPISQDSALLKKFGHSPAEDYQETMDHTKLPGRTSKSVLFPDSYTKSSETVLPSKNKSFVKDDETKNRVIVNETDSSRVVRDLLNLTSEMINLTTSYQKGNLNPINSLFSRNRNFESHYSKLLEFYQGLSFKDSNEEKFVDSEPNEQISQTIGLSNMNNPDNINSMQISADKETNIDEKTSFIVKNLFDVQEISSELAKDSSVNNEQVVKEIPNFEKDETKSLYVVDKIVEDSSIVHEDVEDIFGVSDNFARDLSVSKDLSTFSAMDRESSHKFYNITGEENLKDFPTFPFLNPSKESAFTSKLEMKQEVEEMNTNTYDLENIETLLDKQSHQLPEEDKLEKLETLNSFRTLDVDIEEDKIHNEKTEISGLNQPLANLPIVGTTNVTNFIPKFLSRLDRTLGSSNFLRNPDENFQKDVEIEHISSDETNLVDLNLPILYTNVADSRPAEMSRRFGLVRDDKNIKNDFTHQDRQFSLQKALDRLRLLDAGNALSSSRQSKTASQKRKEPTSSPNEEISNERSYYLENLRKRLFEN